MAEMYGAFENLRRHKAVLHNAVALNSGIHLAAWSNKRDTITQYCDHHTLSLYVADGSSDNNPAFAVNSFIALMNSLSCWHCWARSSVVKAG
jgi:hypothetical protein